MGGLSNCCCNNCDPSCVGVLANTFNVSIGFDGSHTIAMTNRATAPACPSWSGSVCWSAASTLHSSCSVDTTLTPTCNPAACQTCGETISSDDPVTWPGQPAYTTVGFGSRHKFSVNRWDKTKYYADLSVLPLGGTLYAVSLKITYYHSIRFTLSSCVEYCYAIITQGACPDDTAPNDGVPYSGTRTCSVGSLSSCGTSPTLPAHIDPFENDVAIVCPAVGFLFPFSSGVNHACTAISFTVVNVAITGTTCVCCDPGTGVGYWETPASTQAVNTGSVCNSDLLAVYCADTGGAGSYPSICDEGLLVTMTINYESAAVECTALCSAAIRLERIPVGGEANPPVDIAASTLSRTACDVTVTPLLSGYGACSINQDRPLIAKPAEIYVTLPCA